MVAISISNLSSIKPPTSYGPELVDVATQGASFSTSVLNGAGYDLTATGNFMGLNQNGVLTIGKSYRVHASWSGNDEALFLFSNGLSEGGNHGNAASDEIEFTAVADLTGFLFFVNGSIASDTIFMQIHSIREVLIEPTFGSNLVRNGDASQGADFWVGDVNSSVSSVAGRIRSTLAQESNPRAVQAIDGLTIGTKYRLRCTPYNGQDTGNLYVRISTDIGISTGHIVDGKVPSGIEQVRNFVAAATTHYLGVVVTAEGAGTYVEIENAIIEQVITDAHLPETVLGASDTLAFASGQKMVLMLRNTSGGALTPKLDGADGTTVDVPGIGPVDVSAGYTMASIPNGATVAIALDSIKEFCKGTLTITGADGMTATCVRY